MRKTFLALSLCVFFSSYYPASAQDTKGTLTGRWLVTADFHGTPLYFKLELTQQGDKLSGNFGGDKTWPAPQSDWPKLTPRPWPPPVAFDSLPVQATVDGFVVKLISSS